MNYKHKQILLLSLLLSIFLSACTKEELNTQSNTSAVDKSILDIAPNGTIPDSITIELERLYRSRYAIDSTDNNSHLWIDNTDLKSYSPTYTVYGYDKELYVSNYKTYFSQGLRWDTRLNSYKNTVFLAEIKLYHKRIAIPRGATLILPPPYVLESLQSIGRTPIGYKPSVSTVYGYGKLFIGSTSTEDVYELLTEAVVVRYNVSGRLIFSPPVYMPERAKNGPSSFVFKYQYSYIDWEI